MKLSMRVHRGTASIVVLSFTVLGSGNNGAAQETPASHIAYVAEGFPQAPDGQGLLPTAVAETQIAVQHTTLAADDTSNLQAMQSHVGHVLHAIDPTQATSGPGRGFGVKQAADLIAEHITLAAAAPGASPNIVTHAAHVASAARSVSQLVDEIAEVARGVRSARNYADAGVLVERLQVLVPQLMTGRDADGDAQVGWEEGEAGLQQLAQHMTLLRQGEG